MNINNILSRFSPILTDEENEDKMVDEKEDRQDIDLASNILNSLNEVNLKPDDRPHQAYN